MRVYILDGSKNQNNPTPVVKANGSTRVIRVMLNPRASRSAQANSNTEDKDNAPIL